MGYTLSQRPQLFDCQEVLYYSRNSSHLVSSPMSRFPACKITCSCCPYYRKVADYFKLMTLISDNTDYRDNPIPLTQIRAR